MNAATRSRAAVIPVDIEFDAAKSRKNALERRLPFELVTALDWREALTFVDDRRDYGEVRYVAYVPMGGRLHVVCYTMRGEVFRIISFRKANRDEIDRYAEAADR